MDTYIKGTYKRKIFASNDGFVVGLLKIKETNDQDLMDYKDKLFTFTGLFAELKIDENYVFYGNVIDNPKYGIQYKVNKYEKIMPEDKDGLILFLSSDIFYDENGIYSSFEKFGILAVEMEAYGLYLEAMKAKKKALTLLSVTDHFATQKKLTPEERQTGLAKMIEVALELA